MKLFLCNTPLQALIASRIIATESIKLHDCAVLYVCDRLNAKANSAFVKISPLVKYAKLIEKARSISGVRCMRKFISQIGPVDEIFVACIDDSLAHYAISFTNGATLKTFDDGTANIIPSSSYFGKAGSRGVRGSLLKIFHRINGNRYSLEMVKAESKTHYTIYDRFSNVMKNTKFITLFEVSESNRDLCSVFTGVEFKDYCKTKGESELLIGKVRNFLSTLPGDVIYMGNLGVDEHQFPEHVVDRDLIVEETVISVINKYKRVDLYGFADLPQNLFMDKAGVTVKPVSAKELAPEVVKCVKRLSEISGSEVVEI